MKLLFSPKAEADLDTAAGYLGERNVMAALAFVERVRTVVRRLAVGEFEGIGQKLRSGECVRSWPVPPYRIYYQRTADVL